MNHSSAGEAHDDLTDGYDDPSSPEPLGLAPDPVEIRRNAGLAALIGAVASGVAIAYLGRATSTGSVVDWTLVVLMGLLGVGHLVAFVDARTPLLVADNQGVRIRLGRTWRGMPWSALAHVEHTPRRGPVRDGRLVLVARNPERVLAELDASGRRQTRLAQRLYGAPFAVPLALSTRVSGAGDDLGHALTRLAGDPSLVVEPEQLSAPEVEVEAEIETEPRPHRWHDPRPRIAHLIGVIAARIELHRERALDDELAEDEADEGEPTIAMPPVAARPGLVASATPSPLREPLSGARAEIRSDLTLGATALAPDHDETEHRPGLPEARELRRPGSVNLVEDTMLWSDRVRPISRAGSSVEPLVIDEFAVEPAEDPVVGPELSAARTRLGLSVDQLAERTRIRPHVIESIEVDDFVPCGGDFYARGHLRTLARVLGVDAAPLLTSYDERYADAPVDPRRIFEAELATGAHGSIRSTRGGPNWSVLIAAVMTLVLCWSFARLIMDSPVHLQQPTTLNGSGGPNGSAQPLGDPVPVVLTATGGARVVVRDGANETVFNGSLSFQESKTLRSVVPPVRVQSSDGSLVVSIDGRDRGALGADGQPAQNTFPVE